MKTSKKTGYDNVKPETKIEEKDPSKSATVSASSSNSKLNSFRGKPKKNSYQSDVDDEDIELFRPQVIDRALNYKEDEEKYEILGAHNFNGQLKFAVRHKEDGKVYWHSHDTMKVDHLGLLLHYYEKHIAVKEIAVV